MNDNGHFRSNSRPHAALAIALIRLLGEGDAEQRISAFTDNISPGGLFATAPEPFVVGERLEVELTLPSTWTPQRFNVEVLRIQQETDGPHYGVGLKFIKMTDAQSFALAELAASLEFDS